MLKPLMRSLDMVWFLFLALPALDGVLLVQNLAEAVETVLPHAAAIVDPALGGAQALLVHAAGAHPPDLLGPHETAVFEHGEVLHDGGQRHGERLGELADRCR